VAQLLSELTSELGALLRGSQAGERGPESWLTWFLLGASQYDHLSLLARTCRLSGGGGCGGHQSERERESGARVARSGRLGSLRPSAPPELELAPKTIIHLDPVGRRSYRSRLRLSRRSRFVLLCAATLLSPQPLYIGGSQAAHIGPRLDLMLRSIYLNRKRQMYIFIY